jgi:O-antigen/teichoic acid export membrane protein
MLATLRWAGVVGVLAWIDNSIEAFFLWQGLVSLLSVVFFVWKTYRILPAAERPARFDITALVRIRGFAGGMAVTTLLAILLTQIDKLLLSKLVSLESFGYYTLATSAASVLYFLTTPIVTAVAPRLTELVAKSDMSNLIDTYHRASQGLAVLLIPVTLVMAIFAEPVLYVWTGNVALSQQVAPLLVLLALGVMLNGFMHVPYMIQLAYGWTSFAVWLNLVSVGVIVPVILWAVPRFGATGAAWAWLLLNLGYVFVGVHFMHRRLLLDEKWRWYRDAVLKPTGVATLTVLIVYLLLPLSLDRYMLAIELLGVTFFVIALVAFSVPVTKKFLVAQFFILWGVVCQWLKGK